MSFLRAEFDLSGWERLLDGLYHETRPAQMTPDLVSVANAMIGFAIAAPIPTAIGNLAASAEVVPDFDKGQVLFGFTEVYATIQDLGGTIVPRRKSALFLPLDERARRVHRFCQNPEDEGLRYGEDYILKSQVIIRQRGYGSPFGANLYFTGTLQKHGNTALALIAQKFNARIKRLLAS